MVIVPTATATTPEAAILMEVLSVQDGEQGGLLRLAASLVWHLDDAYAQALVRAAEAAGIHPAPLEGPHLWATQEGILSMVDGRALALGRLEFLQRLGLRPHVGEIAAAHRQEARGCIPFFLVTVSTEHCIGLLGIRLSSA